MPEIDFQTIELEHLYFDPENPRLPLSVDGDDERQVLEWMLDDAGLVELMGSIAVNGYFAAEPLLVTKRKSGDGYWVLEGNRRLAAVRLLNEPSLAPIRRQAVHKIAHEVADGVELTNLPCAVFERREDVLDYLGYRHITGVKQWEPEAKARYLQSLYLLHRDSAGGDIYRVIARLIGSRSDYVVRLLASLALHDQMRTDQRLAQQLAASAIPFSLLTLAMSYETIVKYLGLDALEVAVVESEQGPADAEALRDVATWLYRELPDLGRTQLGESHNMKLLAQSLSNDRGVDALRNGEIVEEAARASIDPDALIVRAIRQSIERLVIAQSLLHRSEVTDATLQAVEEIEDLVDQLGGAIRRKAKRNMVQDA
ncbi:hypothetical protein OVA14_05550 [Agrococcus sp. SL85]|uniref:hypothetical protein n=1 Tax=Agrococcus sp. SL85 TaxID=2995141 RepID=UPI00226CC2C8|nr:hypothetical protein [Agrococcus sp. SL85]WAC67207.1 hypothetical protein OVA14_05550 [Agrococcus sp. SL85]